MLSTTGSSWSGSQPVSRVRTAKDGLNDWPAALGMVGVTDEEFAAFDSHCRASDYAETSSTWKVLGIEAGFAHVEELFIAPNGLARIYRYYP